MIIFYGTRSSDSETRLNTPCNNCRQPALLQSDWHRYFHIMWIPTFPIDKHREINCQACGNSYEGKASTPIWTFLGAMIFACCLLVGAGQYVVRHFVPGFSAASLTAAADDAPAATPATPATTTTPPAVATPSTAPRAAAPRPAVPGASRPAAASSKGGAPSASASAARPKKR
jgi:hypothetical protein